MQKFLDIHVYILLFFDGGERPRGLEVLFIPTTTWNLFPKPNFTVLFEK